MYPFNFGVKETSAAIRPSCPPEPIKKNWRTTHLSCEVQIDQQSSIRKSPPRTPIPTSVSGIKSLFQKLLTPTAPKEIEEEEFKTPIARPPTANSNNQVRVVPPAEKPSLNFSTEFTSSHPKSAKRSKEPSPTPSQKSSSSSRSSNSTNQTIIEMSDNGLIHEDTEKKEVTFYLSSNQVWKDFGNIMRLLTPVIKKFKDGKTPDLIQRMSEAMVKLHSCDGDRELAVQEITSFHQGSSDMQTYAAKIRKLGRYAYDRMEEQSRDYLMAQKFLTGLDEDIRTKIRRLESVTWYFERSLI
uniref:Retrotransposon gag domain-containing protein n=2 Tax=Caenorhabditis japonica TaxID=281687 RepID=A0A8R1DEL9_CAEJA